MRIVHFNTNGFGGAFEGSYRLHLALLNGGLDSNYVVLNQKKNGPRLKKVFLFDGHRRKSTIIQKLIYRFGWPQSAEQKNWQFKKATRGASYEVFSSPLSMIDILSDSRVKDSDLIHLHWVAGFIDYPSFFRKNKKPVVWTLRDLNPFSGCFHYETDLDNNPHLSKISRECEEIKRKSVAQAQCRVYIAGISQWITEKSRSSPIFQKMEHLTINNGLDHETYGKYTKEQARKLLSVPKNHLVFSFVGDHQEIHRKGLSLLIQVLEKLDKKNNIFLMTAGSSTNELLSRFKGNYSDFGFLDQSQLDAFYTASDAFIFPSLEEAFGNVIIESMACGTPVISFSTGGALDVIAHGINGLISRKKSVDDLTLLIQEYIDGKYKFDPMKIKNIIARDYSLNVLQEKYIQLYNKALDQHRG